MHSAMDSRSNANLVTVMNDALKDPEPKEPEVSDMWRPRVGDTTCSPDVLGTTVGLSSFPNFYPYSRPIVATGPVAAHQVRSPN